MYSTNKLIKKCLLRIEERLDWGPSAKWHNDVYSELSSKIHEETHVLLSPTTLKRVWGKVKYKSAPSITTLNTLSQFAGFKNWRAFQLANKGKQKKPFFSKVSSNMGSIMLASSLMTLVFISLYSLRDKNDILDPDDFSNTLFESRPITEGLPNSVVFDFDIEAIPSDNIYIQQYWDPRKTIKLEKGQQQATGQYYYPGYFRAKLLIDGTIIKEHDLFIKSDQWLGTIDYEPIPKYIGHETVLNGQLSFPALLIEELNSSEKPLSSTFHLVDEFQPVSGDNFVLSSRLKNDYRDKWAVCQRAQITILGTKSAIIVGTSIPGCVSEIGIMMSDVYLSGKEHDLSGLGVDLSEFLDISIEVRDKSLRVYVDDTVIFNGKYNQSVGNIVGLRYKFLGAGTVSKVHLYNPISDTKIIDESFQRE